jgi:hypothetical protein
MSESHEPEPPSPMSKAEVLKTLLRCRWALDGIVSNQAYGGRRDGESVVTSAECLRLDKISREIFEVGSGIAASDQE